VTEEIHPLREQRDELIVSQPALLGYIRHISDQLRLARHNGARLDRAWAIRALEERDDAAALARCCDLLNCLQLVGPSTEDLSDLIRDRDGAADLIAHGERRSALRLPKQRMRARHATFEAV
jgi:hypothetical protein